MEQWNIQQIAYMISFGVFETVLKEIPCACGNNSEGTVTFN